ncbi:MAG TPA: VWA domain-containing protein, partial [Candidatus Acidoferrum sp.]|nr:VWA domain-containing protein [Candidatus Acidoferrum sp.]
MKKNSHSKETSVTWLAALTAGALLLFVYFAQAAGQEPPAQSSASAQNASQAPVDATQQPGAVIKAESRLVLVDAVVTDKKGNYVHDLAEKDFKVYEDNKQQPIASFSFGSDPNIKGPQQRRYLVLFFDNSTMAAPDQIQAKDAARKFIDANAGPDRLMAVVDFGGTLRIAQNFTANPDLLRAAVGGVKSSSVDPNAQPPVEVASAGLAPNNLGGPPSPFPSISNAEAQFGARSMLLSVRSLAKNLRAIPGRKMLVLFSSGFPLNTETEAELTATIDACNKANVAVYALDARGLVTMSPAGSSKLNLPALGPHDPGVPFDARSPVTMSPAGSSKLNLPTLGPYDADTPLAAQNASLSSPAHAQNAPLNNRVYSQDNFTGGHLVLASYSPAVLDLQRPGGGGGTGGGGGRPGGGTGGGG